MYKNSLGGENEKKKFTLTCEKHSYEHWLRFGQIDTESHARIAYLCKVFESIYSWHGYMYLIILASIDTHYC